MRERQEKQKISRTVRKHVKSGKGQKKTRHRKDEKNENAPLLRLPPIPSKEKKKNKTAEKKRKYELPVQTLIDVCCLPNSFLEIFYSVKRRTE